MYKDLWSLHTLFTLLLTSRQIKLNGVKFSNKNLSFLVINAMGLGKPCYNYSGFVMIDISIPSGLYLIVNIHLFPLFFSH